MPHYKGFRIERMAYATRWARNRLDVQVMHGWTIWKKGDPVAWRATKDGAKDWVDRHLAGENPPRVLREELEHEGV